jgi:glucose-1-phosphate cytidylyltransferase
MSVLTKTTPSEAVKQVLRDSPLVILCGGKGTRLREETEWRPKPMVNIGEWPILWHIMRYYSCFGVRRFMLCLGYKGQVIRDFFVSYHERWADLKIQLGKNKIHFVEEGYEGDDWDITLVNTGLETKTGGRVASMSRYIESERFFLTYGDGLADIDLYGLVENHLNAGTIGTVTAVRPPSRFGELTIDKNESVKSFSEKPQVSEGWVNGGFFVFNQGLFDYIPNPDVSLELQPLHQLAQDGQLSAYKHEGFWQCVDTYRELEYMEKLWASNNAAWRVW